jgi:heme exporter protein D
VKILTWLMAVGVAGIQVAQAQTDVVAEVLASVTPPVESTSMDWRQIIETGGWLMYVLGAMSVAGVALVIYFLYVVRREQVLPRQFLEQVRAQIREGRLVEASHACRTDSSALAAILGAALDYVPAQQQAGPRPAA